MSPRLGTFIFAFLMTFVPALADAAGTNETQPGEIRAVGTLHCVGVEWDLQGDANHNATCKVEFQAAGDSQWNQAFDLVRCDFRGNYAGAKADRHYNMLAGSILHLKPGTEYQIKLSLADADGGGTVKTIKANTKPDVTIGEGRRILHVIPGNARRNSNNTGSEEKPFQGLKEAQMAAMPGDLFLLHAGYYERFRFEKSGTDEKSIVWQAAEEGDVTFNAIEVSASNVWIEGMYLERTTSRSGIQAVGKPSNVVIKRNVLLGFPFSVMLNSNCENWLITQNHIDGRSQSETKSDSGEGINLGKSSRHTVSHNFISGTADGIVYPRSDCDVFGNELIDLSEDALKWDYGYANNRVWGNRLTNIAGHAVTFQPMNVGPWFFVRNQVVNVGSLFKFRVQDRFVMVNNTFVTQCPFGEQMQYVLTAYSRNNLFVASGKRNADSPMWSATNGRPARYYMPSDQAANWASDLDYDGFDWGDVAQPFSWKNGEARYADIEAFATAVGIEKHAKRVKRDEIFEKIESPDGTTVTGPQVLSLKPGCTAIDAGALVPNLINSFDGKAPDLGAHELNQPPAIYGPTDPNRAAPQPIQ